MPSIDPPLAFQGPSVMAMPAGTQHNTQVEITIIINHVNGGQVMMGFGHDGRQCAHLVYIQCISKSSAACAMSAPVDEVITDCHRP
jgi:hypothetical protein